MLVIVIPFLAIIVAIVNLWGWAFTWVELTLLVVMYFATGFGITIGYHRLFTHRSFDTSRPMKFMWGVLGCMSVQGPILKWVAIHRRHHQYSDIEHDPHSPHHFGGGVHGILVGFWHAHAGWMFTADHPNLSDYVGDLQSDRLIRVTSNLFPLWVFLGLVIPMAIGGLIHMSWTGAFLGLLWGGLVRMFLVHHVTFSINSMCHIWGGQRFDCQDQSRNNVIAGVFALGEGWHNNHHAFPTSARHGLTWWEFDLSYIVIRLMTMTGLAWQVRVPTPEAIQAKKERSEISWASEPSSVDRADLGLSEIENDSDGKESFNQQEMNADKSDPVKINS